MGGIGNMPNFEFKEIEKPLIRARYGDFFQIESCTFKYNALLIQTGYAEYQFIDIESGNRINSKIYSEDDLTAKTLDELGKKLNVKIFKHIPRDEYKLTMEVL